jgi:hypothetical protein
LLIEIRLEPGTKYDDDHQCTSARLKEDEASRPASAARRAVRRKISQYNRGILVSGLSV